MFSGVSKAVLAAKKLSCGSQVLQQKSIYAIN